MSLWRCDDCGGPAWWNIAGGVPWYLCMDPDCAAQLDFVSSLEYLDMDLSVSALVEGEETARGR